MGRIVHPDFEDVAGVTVWTGKVPPPTAEQQAAYEASLTEEAS